MKQFFFAFFYCEHLLVKKAMTVWYHYLDFCTKASEVLLTIAFALSVQISTWWKSQVMFYYHSKNNFDIASSLKGPQEPPSIPWTIPWELLLWCLYDFWRKPTNQWERSLVIYFKPVQMRINTNSWNKITIKLQWPGFWFSLVFSITSLIS